MANLLFTGFNGITTAKMPLRFPGSNTTYTIIGTRAGFRGNMLQLGNQEAGWPVALVGSPAEIFMGFHWNLPSAPGARRRIFYLDNASGQPCDVYYNNANSKIEIADAGGTVRVTSSMTVSAGALHWLEFRFVVSDASGIMELYVDGVFAGSATGLDTKPGASTGIDTLKFGNNTWGQDFDDFYVNNTSGGGADATYWGEIAVDRVDTSANDSVAYTPLSSTNESNIDDGDTPDDDTSYNASSVAGDVDLFALAGYTAPTTVIRGVCVRVHAKKTDVGTRTFRPKIKSGSTTVDGTTSGLTTSYAEYSQLVALDPNTSAAWADAAAINAAKIGYETVS